MVVNPPLAPRSKPQSSHEDFLDFNVSQGVMSVRTPADFATHFLLASWPLCITLAGRGTFYFPPMAGIVLI